MQQPPNSYPQFQSQQGQQPSQPLTPPQQSQQQPDYAQPKAYNSLQNKPPPPNSTSKTLDRTLWILIGKYLFDIQADGNWTISIQ